MIDVVLPALNEAGAIAVLLEQMPTGFRPIVVDNGSTDGTADVAGRYGARVVHEATRGFGAACHAGLRAATTDVVCFMHADGSLDPAELPGVTDPVAAGRADLVLGRRVPTAGAWPRHARLLNSLLARQVRRRTRIALHDIGPMRAARRHELHELAIADRRFGWPLEMVLRAAQAGWVVTEIPVTYSPRIGRSKVTGTLRGTLRTVHDMSRALAG